MYNSSTGYRPFVWLVALIGLLILSGCTSRYKLDLFITAQEKRIRATVETTQLVRSAVLANPASPNRYLSGQGCVLVITTGSRGQSQKRGDEYVLSFDEYVRTRLYFQLPAPPTVDSIPLEGNSFCLLMGRYDKQQGNDSFLPVNGFLVVDSITSRDLFATILGKFENNAREVITFDGRFKAKIND